MGKWSGVFIPFLIILTQKAFFPQFKIYVGAQWVIYFLPPPPNIPLKGGGSNWLTIFSFHFDRVISLLPTHGNPFRHSRWNQSNISQVEINILRVKTIVIMFKSFNNTCKSIDKTCTSIVDMLKSTVHTFKSIVIMFKPIVNTCTSIVNKCKHIVTRATCKNKCNTRIIRCSNRF